MLATRMRMAAGTGSYIDKVLSYSPIAYWPCAETSGTNADNAEGTAARDGTYNNVSLNATTGPDGNPAPQWDGSSDWLDIYSVSFDTALDGQEGAVIAWAKVTNIGVWSDGASRDFFTLRVDGSNQIRVNKDSTANTFIYRYSAGGVVRSVTKSSFSDTGWFHIGMTWSKSAAGGSGELKAYLAGAQEGATLTIGTFSGSLDSARTNIGANSTVPAVVWNGYLSHMAVFTSALSGATMLDLATI